MARIGLIGGLSWESTASYYRYLNEAFHGPSDWSQPEVIVDSIDFGEIVEMQRNDDWAATGKVLAASARRLELAGATVLAICANTMHVNLAEVRDAVDVPIVDVRDAVAHEVLEKGARTLALLGTKYLIEKDFYSSRLESLGVSVVRPNRDETERMQSIIFNELVRGIITTEARDYLLTVAASCRERGAAVVGLCCTEFGLLMGEDEPFAVIDSTKAHVRALLKTIG